MTLAAALRTPLDSEPRDFSIILGGPLFQLLRRAHISGDALELARRRVFVIALFAWLPLLVLCIASGDAFGGRAAVPFVRDVQAHVRFLVAMPLLIVAELVVHMRLRPVAYEFLTRGLVPADAIGRFQEKLVAAMRLRNSVSAEVLMIVAVYAFGVPVVWRQIGALDVTTWYAVASDKGAQLTLPGLWYAYVSVPLFQFLMLRWYFRLVVWMRFLWGVSRIRLDLYAMHADRMAGLGFLSATVFAFIPLAMAHGALLAGTIANRIFYAGQTLSDSRYEIAIVVAFLLVLVLGPLVVFAPQVAQAKREAARIFGRLSQRYVREFEATWLPGGSPAATSPLGTGDIQSLADLGNSFETLRAARVVPITRDSVLGLAIATLLPVAPLLFTVIPAEEIAKRLITLIL
jgi:hypothetical protein